MTKEEWISHKIGILVREGRPQAQAAAIAYSMWERGDHKQEGGLPTAQQGLYFANGQDLYGNMVKNAQQMQPTGYTGAGSELYGQNQPPQPQPQPQPNMYTGIPSLNYVPSQNVPTKAEYEKQIGANDYIQGDANLSGKVDDKDKVDKYGQPLQGGVEGEPKSQDWVKYNILNPYNQGMDLGTSVAYTGQQFGKGNVGMGAVGAGLSLLKGARSYLSGYASGKGQQNLEKSYHENQFNRDEDLYRRTDNYQQGGQLPYSQEAIFPTTVVPGQAAQDPTIVPVPTPAQAATPTNVDEGKGYDKNSARDTWTKKTGLPWSEAKRLGYTNGTASDNMKLLGDLNDPRFKRENLRSKPFTSPTQQVQQAQAAAVIENKKPLSYAEYMKMHNVPAYVDKHHAQLSALPPETVKKVAQAATPQQAIKAIADNRSLQSGVVTDKRQNMNYVIENGKVIKSFPVLTGQNVNGTDNTQSLDQLANNKEGRATPTGAYIMSPNAGIYGERGLDMNAIAAFGQAAPKSKDTAYHVTYPEEFDTRNPLYAESDPRKRDASYGCVNCKKEDINYLTERFPKGDTAIVVDSKRGNDREFLKKLGIKQEGGDIMQQGGLTQADMLTGNYMTGQGQQNPNVEVEDGEHTLNSQTGQVQEVVGDKHVDGGEKVNLPNKSKVLSDYTKIGSSNAVIFNEMFDIKVKASDTFANVLDKYNAKIGIKKLETEEKELLEKLEKNTKTPMDKSTKKINEDFLAQEISAINKQKEALNKLKTQAFETIFNEQEKVPKKGDGTQILDKAGNPIKQMGGYTKDKDYYQEGGQPQQGGQPDPSQIVQAYAQLSGQDPNEVIQQIQQLPADQQQAALQQMMQAIQQGQGQQAQPQMREGGMYEDLTYHQTKTVVEEKPYTFSTQYTPKIEGYDVTGTGIVNAPTLSDVEYMQHYNKGKGYGQKMADINKTIDTHKWYFDTEAKKKAFREAAASQDSKGIVKDFQNAYNQEITKRGKEAGLNQDQISSAINDVGFTGSGVQQFDDKFGAFTSTRPLFGFDKNKPQPIRPTEPTPQAGVVPKDVVKNIIPMEGMPYVMPPSAPIAPYLQQVDLSRLESRKGSVENQLQASENARQAAYEATKGLPPAQAAAMMANYLSTSGQQDVQGIANQEIADTTDRVRTEQYNAGQLDKEKLLNEQLKKQYEREAFGTLNVNEQNWRNYYDANDANRQALSDKIDRRNIMNVGLTNYQLNGSGGIDFVNKSSFQGADPAIAQYTHWFNTLTPEQQIAERKRKYEAMNTTPTPAAGNVVDLSKYKI